jgi:hypothetical protein
LQRNKSANAKDGKLNTLAAYFKFIPMSLQIFLSSLSLTENTTIFKDQLCSQFTKKEIYNQMYYNGPVPGVAQLVFHAVFESKFVKLKT